MRFFGIKWLTNSTQVGLTYMIVTLRVREGLFLRLICSRVGKLPLPTDLVGLTSAAARHHIFVMGGMDKG